VTTTTDFTVAGELDLRRMRDSVFFEGPDLRHRLSRFWLLLPLAAVIAAAGVVSDSTATVIGAMIVAPLMTPILGVVLATVLGDRVNLLRSVGLVVAGSAAVVAIGYLVGLFVPYPVVASTSTQVAARISPRVVDLVAALATGAVGAVALARSDIADTLPGVAIAISLVPPLAVVGLTWESGASQQALGSLLLFVTNVVAILASGIAVMTLYRVRRASGRQRAATARQAAVAAVVAVLLAAVIVPLWANTEQHDHLAVQVTGVQSVAERWAAEAGWAISAVNGDGRLVLVDADGPSPAPKLSRLRQELDAAGLGGVPVEVSLQVGRYRSVPG
jgi:uncharacterized hydrophobic protein (TIGR00271 family)